MWPIFLMFAYIVLITVFFDWIKHPYAAVFLLILGALVIAGVMIFTAPEFNDINITQFPMT